MSSRGDMTICVVPCLSELFSCNTTWLARLHLSRSLGDRRAVDIAAPVLKLFALIGATAHRHIISYSLTRWRTGPGVESTSRHRKLRPTVQLVTCPNPGCFNLEFGEGTACREIESAKVRSAESEVANHLRHLEDADDLT